MNDLKCPFCGNSNGSFEVIGTVIIFNCEYKIIICPRCNQQYTIPSFMVKRCVTFGEFVFIIIFILLVLSVFLCRN